MRRATGAWLTAPDYLHLFLPTLSMRRATTPAETYQMEYIISTHALHAESDYKTSLSGTGVLGFLPTLSMRRATPTNAELENGANWISTHALHAESDCCKNHPCSTFKLFLPTLSMRRATRIGCACDLCPQHFYPRSPCGERQQKTTKTHTKSTANL